jgi:predicted nuclease of predicted toxin-antitoxin system
MKLLLDENLSYRIVRKIRDLFPGSEHVNRSKLRERSDRSVCEYASDQGFVLVSKDSDFVDLATSLPAPPKVIWLSIGNAGTARIAKIIRKNVRLVRAFGDDAVSKVLVLRL